MILSEKTKSRISAFQKNEITEYNIYRGLAGSRRNESNRVALGNIAKDELKHYNIWKKYTGVDVPPDRFKVWFYSFISIVFGITFSVKLMENGEGQAQETYGELIDEVNEAKDIQADETKHERELVGMIDEERLNYISSVVLGLNDAIVELTGTLAGLTFALQNVKVVGVAGLITGIAAALSMAASEYLSTKADAGKKNPIKASIYTGITYIGAVLLLVLPYLIVPHHLVALVLMLLVTATLIFLFTFYYTVVRDIPFRSRFVEMITISFGVAGLSFLIGLAVRYAFGVNL